MPTSRQNIAQRIRRKWGQELEHWVHRYPAEAMGTAPDLTDSDRRESPDLPKGLVATPTRVSGVLAPSGGTAGNHDAPGRLTG